MLARKFYCRWTRCIRRQADEIEAILSKVDALVSLASDIKEYALQRAVSGKEWKEWKSVEGRFNRKEMINRRIGSRLW